MNWREVEFGIFPLLAEEGNIYRISQHCQFIHTLIDRPYRESACSLQDDLELCLQFVLHFYCTASYLNGFDHKAALFEPVLAGCAVSSLFEMREAQWILHRYFV